MLAAVFISQGQGEKMAATDGDIVALPRNAHWDEASGSSRLRTALSRPHFTPAPSESEGPPGLVPGNSSRGPRS